ncbi:MAG: LEA type 2 family protein [Myxococcota bacterium]
MSASMKRFSLLLSTACLIGAGCAALQGLSAVTGIQPPEVQFDTVNYRAVDFDALHCDIAFAVKNPNRIGGRLDGYDMKLVVDGVTLADGKVDKALDLGPGKTTTLIIPAVVRWSEIANRLTAKKGIPDELPWKIAGTAYIKVADQPIALPFERDGALPVLRPPSITPVAVRVGNASFTSIHVDVDVEMKSNGGHPLAIGALNHDVSLAGQEVLKGTMPAAGKIFGSSVRTLSADVSTLQVGLALMKTLQSKQAVPVRLRGHTDVDTGFGVVPFPFDATTKIDPR